MIELYGYAILPSGNTIQDYSDLISYLENGEACITGGSWELEEHMLKSIKLFPLEYLDDLIQLQRVQIPAHLSVDSATKWTLIPVQSDLLSAINWSVAPPSSVSMARAKAGINAPLTLFLVVLYG